MDWPFPCAMSEADLAAFEAQCIRECTEFNERELNPAPGEPLILFFFPDGSCSTALTYKLLREARKMFDNLRIQLARELKRPAQPGETLAIGMSVLQDCVRKRDFGDAMAGMMISLLGGFVTREQQTRFRELVRGSFFITPIGDKMDVRMLWTTEGGTPWAHTWH